MLCETTMPSADSPLVVWVHIRESIVPEEPDILLVGDGLRMEEIKINIRIGTEVKKVARYGMNL